jgi:hypothetical protein
MPHDPAPDGGSRSGRIDGFGHLYMQPAMLTLIKVERSHRIDQQDYE